MEVQWFWEQLKMLILCIDYDEFVYFRETLNAEALAP